MAKSRNRMGSEFLREAAVLVLIFAILDKVVKPGLGTWGILWRTSVILAISGILYFWGVRLEEMEPRDEALRASKVEVEFDD